MLTSPLIVLVLGVQLQSQLFTHKLRFVEEFLLTSTLQCL